MDEARVRLWGNGGNNLFHVRRLNPIGDVAYFRWKLNRFSAEVSRQVFILQKHDRVVGAERARQLPGAVRNGWE